MSKRSEMRGEKADEHRGHFLVRFKKSWDEEGVASTVGTILAIMVFLTFLGMFVNQYVPIWMKENENTHMNQVVGQISNLKSAIDLQILSVGKNIATAPIYSPIQLHSEGVPVFASPTIGRLSFVATNPSTNYTIPSSTLAYTYRYLDSTSTVRTVTLNATNGGRVGGSLEFYGPNRYFVPQTVAYENGAIILNQSDGEVVLSGISMRVANYSGDIIVQFTQIELVGSNITIGGYGTKSISTTVEYSTYQSLNNSLGSDLTLTIYTTFGHAWAQYFKDMANNSDADVPSWLVSLESMPMVNDNEYYKVVMTISDVKYLEYTKAVATVTIADIGV